MSRKISRDYNRPNSDKIARGFDYIGSILQYILEACFETSPLKIIDKMLLKTYT